MSAKSMPDMPLPEQSPEQTSERQILTIGPYRFDPESGEVWPADGEADALRLKPQPALLLALLIEKDGDLLSRDEIRQAIWPDVQVEFDQSLHFCVHQLRSALRDTPITIETLPRRGYRLLPLAAGDGAPRPTPDARVDVPHEAVSTRGRSRRPLMLILLPLLLLVTVGIALRTTRPIREPASLIAPRLAIMPFRPEDGVRVVGQPWQIAERVLLELGNLGPEILPVIGPTTTGRWGRDFPDLPHRPDDIGLDFILNGRFIEPASPSEPWPLLIEIIRVSDGAHIWVQRYLDCSEPDAIALEVTSAIREKLNLPERDARATTLEQHPFQQHPRSLDTPLL